jgi:hypothetical protein
LGFLDLAFDLDEDAFGRLTLATEMDHLLADRVAELGDTGGVAWACQAESDVQPAQGARRQARAARAGGW